jgi:hypothetical protein
MKKMHHNEIGTLIKMVEGKGYCARKQERRNAKNMADFIKNKDKIIVIPDLNNKKEETKKKIE